MFFTFSSQLNTALTSHVHLTFDLVSSIRRWLYIPVQAPYLQVEMEEKAREEVKYM